ncbi:u5 snrnp complex [Colletotrichum karsti]|uniref:U5 snrnp complex n=1 Tax=Colletotrichum karsti TaxID=1095194 RepID=A0A9P6LRC6_9PEZI|nr:u5 snrnp complex [Colletotrichum karsti]KAF9882422.1 u5 snrnp complex [Colletotrichum karsti]
MSEKRPASDEPAGQMIVKRQNVGSSTGALARLNGSGSSALIQTAPRTSGLQAPVMELTGHSGEIFAAKFDPTGNFIASGSMDRSILLWRTYGDCENYGILNGHRGAILDLQWSRDSKIVYSASADTHLASWDLENGTRIRRYVGHEEIVNTVDISKRGEEMLVSGSDDGSIGLWDPRTKTAVDHIQTEFPITAIAMSEAGNEVYSGGIDNDIKVWDLRKKSVVYSMLGHQDTVTSLRVSPDSQSLLSFAMDSTVRTWDIRPFAPTDRHIRTFDGASVGLEKNLIRASWDSEGKKVAVGSGDGTATIWSSETGKLMYKLPGHKGTVNCVEFAPGKEPIVLSASSDRNMLLGELRGSNGPDSRPNSGQQHPNRAATDPLPEPHMTRAAGQQPASVAMPPPVAQSSRSETRGRTRRFTGPDPAEMHLAQMAQEGRRRRRRRQRDRQQGDDEGHPKRFLLCLPWVKSRRMRSQILRCFISGTFLALLLAVYLALSLTQNIRSSEFTVLLILIILFTTIFFCHGLIRLCMLVIRPRADEEARPPMPQLIAPGGYAVPREPIRVVLARDEEDQDEISEAAKAKPPAYGLWRESVRVDPNRIYWQRNPNAASGDGPSSSGHGNIGPRPPSYASEDGVSYVVDARPRSMAPGVTEVPLPPHSSEVGRMNERRAPF